MNLYAIRNQLNMGIPITKIKLRVTDYSRVSTTNIEQYNSLINQSVYFDNMIKNNPNWTYINGYIDYGITGTSDIKRNNFMKMINDAKENKFDLIITKEISRFSRNTIDSIKYTRELLNYGVAVLFVNDNINTAQPDSELRLTIMASLAQDEIRRLSSRVKFGMQQSINKGNILGNDMLYGYKKNKQTGNLEIIQHEATIIKEIYQMYTINNLSLNKIAIYLNNNNIKTKQNKQWNTTTIERIIKNPKYKGYYCGKKSEVTDYITKKIKYLNKEEWITYKDQTKIPPIINELLWEKANERLEKRKKQKSTSIYKNKYSFSTKLTCNKHNSYFYRRQNKNNFSWICSNHLKTGSNCPIIKESELKEIINNINKNLNIKLYNIINILKELYKNNIKNDINTSINNLIKEKESILSKKNKLLILNLDNILSTNELKENTNIYNKQLNIIKSNLNNLLQKNNYSNKNILKEINNSIINIINSQIINDKLISLLINKIIIKNNNNNIEIDIYYNINKYYIKKETNLTLTNNLFLKKEYNFNRIKNNKQYTINYLVNCYHI